MKAKRMDFEALRILAIFGVVFNHSQERGFELYMLPGCSAVNYWGSLVLGVLCKTAVPLFLLVSGGLLLDREEPIRTVLRKRAGRILAVLVLFSGVLYLFWTAWGTVERPGLWDFLGTLWSSGVSRPYWYLYAYLGLMLMLPLLRPMVRHMTDAAFCYLALLHFGLYGVLYTISALAGWGPVHPDLLLPMAEPALFYFLMGYYLACRFPWEEVTPRRLRLLWLWAGLAVAGMVLLAHMNFRRTGSPMDYQKSLMLFPVFAIYATARQWFASHTLSGGAERALGALGGCVFGAYLLEGIFRHYLLPLYSALEPRIHVLPACLVWVAAVAAAGMAAGWVLKRLPVLRRLL